MDPTSSLSQAEVSNPSFAQDVIRGLQSDPKRLPSKYFYDERGDKLFQQIMATPEYYLTRCEREIFLTHKQELLEAFGKQPFDIVELGAGDGSKTRILLRHFIQQGASFRYRPVDISGSVLRQLTGQLAQDLPALEVKPLQGDYMKMLERIRGEGERPKIVLFLGSNIGNMEIPAAASFLSRLTGLMNPGDKLLLGVDLKKDPALILAAYDDAGGVTEAFNLNLLGRINRELGGNFDLETFFHWETYDPSSGSARSYLVSRKEQTVSLSRLGVVFSFEAWEPIVVELSQKYSLPELEDMAGRAGLTFEKHFLDRQDYFVDSLWKKT